LVQTNFDLILGKMTDENMEYVQKGALNLAATFKKPVPEPVKTRSETGRAYVDFLQGRAELVSSFRNNAAEIRKIDEMMLRAKTDPAITINRVIIHGYASPEGQYVSNMMLSGRRTAAIKEYIRASYLINENMIVATGFGEDWNTLETMLKETKFAYSEAVIAIMRSTEDAEERKRRIKAIDGGATFNDMLNNLFPMLRRIDYEMQFTVVPFTVEEGKKVLERRPSLLSLNEMFLIAHSYPFGSAEFRNVFDVAANTYPGAEIANFNAAANALHAGNVTEAENYIKKVFTADADYNNNMGMLCALQGRFDEAFEYFRKAVDGGSLQAVGNLEEMESKVVLEFVAKR